MTQMLSTVGRPSPQYALASGAAQWSIYDDPPLYDRVFAERDYEQDVRISLLLCLLGACCRPIGLHSAC